MTVAEKIHVKIGEVRTGGPGQILTAILGSCIGLGFIDRQRGICGLAHCLLSEGGGATSKTGGRHVDEAIRSLVSMMRIAPSSHRGIQAVIVGGANMTMPPDTDPARLIGSINAESAKRLVRELGIRNAHHDTGGTLGRQVSIDCGTGLFEVVRIPRLRS